MYNLTVLIVDDDKITTTILSKMIEKHTLNIYIASDGQRGLDAFLATRPDIVLTDINMPVMSGLTMVEKIRKIDDSVKIAMFTNFDNKEYLLQAIQLGVNQFFSKPFEKNHFTQVIERLCNEITSKHEVEAALRRQSNVLHTINTMANSFLQQQNWSQVLNEEMLALKSASESSALFIFQNDNVYDPLSAKQYLALNDITYAFVPKQITYKKDYLMRWKQQMRKGQTINGLLEDFDASKQRLLQEFAINSLLIIPIFSNNTWWGFMGIGNSEHRRFNTSDDEMLNTVARIIGSAINNQKNLQSLEMTSALFNHTVDGVLITNADNRIIHINDAFSEITGFTRDEVIGKDPKILRSAVHDKKFYQKMWNHLNTEGYWQGEIQNRKRNGEIYLEWLSINAITNTQGEIENHIGVFSDITAHRSTEQNYVHLATHDMLTGLPNRVLLHDRLSHAIQHAERFNKCIAVIFCDLDNFKPINDNYGHNVGDIALKMTADYFQSVLRNEDTICRYGGDEFVIILEELDDIDNINHIAEKITSITTKSFLIDGHPIKLQMSAGISLYPEDGINAKSLIHHADEAMYKAKKNGKNHLQYFKGDKEHYCLTG
ncbi:MAG: PAS domain S-box protein [Epsilonproteobacteria bacterium]|nr:MAG: PAS domain S-box protein [Campylobacterota bacterium]